MEPRKICDLKLLELKDELKKRGLPQQGKKAMLINRLKDNVNSSMLGDDVEEEKTVKCILKRKNNNKTFFQLINYIKRLEQRLQHLETAYTKFKNCVQRKLDKDVSSKSHKRTDADVILGKGQESAKPANLNNVNISKKVPSPTGNNSAIKETRKKSINDGPRILVLGDGSGRDCVEVIKNILTEDKCGYIVSSLFKPNARVEDVILDMKTLCCNYTSFDHVIVLAGSVNARRGCSVVSEIVEDTLKTVTNTNVYILGVPFAGNRRVLNNFAYNINDRLYNIAHKFSHVKFVDINYILHNENITSSSIHLNYKMKQLVLGHLIENVLLNTSINYNNLKYIQISKCPTRVYDVNGKSSIVTVSPKTLIATPKALHCSHTKFTSREQESEIPASGQSIANSQFFLYPSLVRVLGK